jgi:hypothetical protein
LFTANGFVRQDHLTYLPSADLFADQPGTVSQSRRLTNLGIKADIAYNRGRHSLKAGGTFTATKLHEQFTIGFTDPAFNSHASTRPRSVLRTGGWSEVASARPVRPLAGRVRSTVSF